MRTVLSAIFLACSWCWCIGMYFPVLMVRDFGWWGWVAFLVPNCLGAMMVGLIHRRGGAAERVIERHGRAAGAFSAITIVFHVSFLSWFLPTMLAPRGVGAGVALVMAIGVVAMALVVGRWWDRPRVWLYAGAVVFCVSALCAALSGVTGSSFPVAPSEGGRFGLMELAFLAPTVALGFLTCPHLDLTFLRVRRELPGRAGSMAFVLGFAVFFPALMVMTLLYAAPMARGAACVYIVGHIVVQSWFTMSAHFRELRERAGARRGPASASMIVLMVLAAGASYLSRTMADVAGVPATEAVYKFFILFYGVVFPAYIWVLMIPRRASRLAGARIMWAAVGLCVPLAWFGYVREAWALTLGIPLVILGAPLAGRLAPVRAPGGEK